MASLALPVFVSLAIRIVWKGTTGLVRNLYNHKPKAPIATKAPAPTIIFQADRRGSSIVPVVSAVAGDASGLGEGDATTSNFDNGSKAFVVSGTISPLCSTTRSEMSRRKGPNS